MPSTNTPPRSGKSHGLRVIRELVALEPRGTGTDIGGALESLAQGLKKRSVIFLISDFLDRSDYETTLKIVSRKHDVIAFRIQDETELQLPGALPGLNVEGLEDGHTFRFDAAGARSLRAYADASQQLREQTAEICRHAKVDMIDARSDEDLVKPLLRFFRSRRGKR